ncbi:Serpin (serine protease inhibitor) [Popillia japonica]|uniref:Serpin (Serine protease inhibitor) n=1 Tax=Popillia japonica TaxID=7064 RepID=A0AAW1LAK3_POPJA
MLILQMGLEEIYSNQANFSEIIEKENLKVSKIIQKATIEINEEGGEASGTSAVIGVEKIGDHPPPPVFRADRPFMYLLTYDLEESTIPFYRSKFVVVFMGKVAKPEIVN